MFSNLYKLLRLELTKSPCFNDSVLEKVSECCPCLKILNINRTGISDIGLESIYNNKLCLVGLDLGYTKVTYHKCNKISKTYLKLPILCADNLSRNIMAWTG